MAYPNKAAIPVTLTACFALSSVCVALWTTNFSHLTSSSANGTWREVTIDFAARITNPLLSFSDIDSATTLDFGSTAFTIAASTAKLGSSATAVNKTGPSGDLILEDEAAGSVHFFGALTSVPFTVINGAPTGPGNEDRTGNVACSAFAPRQSRSHPPQPPRWGSPSC